MNSPYDETRQPLIVKMDAPPAAYPDALCSILLGVLLAFVLITFFGVNRGSTSV